MSPTVTLSAPKRHTPVIHGHPGSWCDPAPQALMDARFCSGSSDPPDPHFQGMKCSVRPESAEDRLLRNDTGLLERCGELGVTDHRECSRTLFLDMLVPTVTLSAPKRHTPVIRGRPGSWCDPAPQALMDAHFCSGPSGPIAGHRNRTVHCRYADEDPLQQPRKKFNPHFRG